MALNTLFLGKVLTSRCPHWRTINGLLVYLSEGCDVVTSILIYLILAGNCDCRDTTTYRQAMSFCADSGLQTRLYFNQATELEAPFYVRFALPSENRFCESRVVPTQSESWISMPTVLEGSGQLNAPHDAVQIVRWLEGENALWLRFNQVPDSWSETNGVSVPLSDTNRISISLGNSVEWYQTRLNESFELGRSNLLNPVDSSGLPAATDVRIDSESIVLDDRRIRLSATLFPDAQDVESAVEQADIITGQESLDKPCFCSSNTIYGGFSSKIVPWVTARSPYLTQLTLSNPSNHSRQMYLRLRRTNLDEQLSLTLNAYQSLNLDLGTAFPDLMNGSGCSLQVQSVSNLPWLLVAKTQNENLGSSAIMQAHDLYQSCGHQIFVPPVQAGTALVIVVVENGPIELIQKSATGTSVIEQTDAHAFDPLVMWPPPEEQGLFLSSNHKICASIYEFNEDGSFAVLPLTLDASQIPE